MSNKKLLFLGAVSLLIAACKINSTLPDGLSPAPSHFELFSCVDATASEQLDAYRLVLDNEPDYLPTTLTAHNILNYGIEQCDVVINRVVEGVVSKIKRKRGWRSVKPQVRPAIKANLIQMVRVEMLPAYTVAVENTRGNR